MATALCTQLSSKMFLDGAMPSKSECANHACKCYRGALERLVQDNPSYKGSGGLTVKMRKKLVSAARCAIRMRSRETDKKIALASLRRDLCNGPLHCFGLHDSCSPDFCISTRERIQKATSSSLPPSTSTACSASYSSVSISSLGTSCSSHSSSSTSLVSSSSLSSSSTGTLSVSLPPPSTPMSSANTDIDSDNDLLSELNLYN